MGCIEGRVAVEYFNDMQNKIQAQRLGANAPKTTLKNFVFKCHRDGNNIYSVNSIDFHHYNTFCTAGGWVDDCDLCRSIICVFFLFLFDSLTFIPSPFSRTVLYFLQVLMGHFVGGIKRPGRAREK